MSTPRTDGFAHVFIILFAVILVGALGYVGYSAFHKNQTPAATTYSKVQTVVDTQLKNESDVEAVQQKAYSATSSDITSATTNLENLNAN